MLYYSYELLRAFKHLSRFGVQPEQPRNVYLPIMEVLHTDEVYYVVVEQFVITEELEPSHNDLPECLPHFSLLETSD